jgi:hypothetical protein
VIITDLLSVEATEILFRKLILCFSSFLLASVISLVEACLVILHEVSSMAESVREKNGFSKFKGLV